MLDTWTVAVTAQALSHCSVKLTDFTLVAELVACLRQRAQSQFRGTPLPINRSRSKAFTYTITLLYWRHVVIPEGSTSWRIFRIWIRRSEEWSIHL